MEHLNARMWRSKDYGLEEDANKDPACIDDIVGNHFVDIAGRGAVSV